MIALICDRCGGALRFSVKNIYVCDSCNTVFVNEVPKENKRKTLEKATETFFEFPSSENADALWEVINEPVFDKEVGMLFLLECFDKYLINVNGNGLNKQNMLELYSATKGILTSLNKFDVAGHHVLKKESKRTLLKAIDILEKNNRDVLVRNKWGTYSYAPCLDHKLIHNIKENLLGLGVM